LFQCDFYILDSTWEIKQIISGDGTLGIPLYVFLTVLFWDFPPVRVVAFCFFLIWLDLFIKARKWDKEDKEKEKRKQEEQERLRKLERGEHLYLDGEPWYQDLQSKK